MRPIFNICDFRNKEVVIRIFVEVLKTSDLRDGEMTAVDVEGKQVLIVKLDGKFYAIDNICSHKGAPLNEGFLEGNIVTCPWHASQFDVKTGKRYNVPFDERVYGKVSDQKKYEVKVEGNGVKIKL